MGEDVGKCPSSLLTVAGAETPSPRSPLSPRSPSGGDSRLQARLEASSVGLEELTLLRQNHSRAVETIKAMLMANIPEEERMSQKGGCNESYKNNVDFNQGVRGSPETVNCQEGHPLRSSAPAGYCRKRASSLDMSVAKSLALKAKKLSRGTGSHATRSGRNEHSCQAPQRRTRSSSFSTDPQVSAKQARNNNLMKGQSMSILPRRTEEAKNPNSYDQRHNQLEPYEAANNSLMGSFLSLRSPNFPMYKKSQYNNTSEDPLTEMDFNSHFKSVRSLSGSKLKYEFPSPMHAILLHYDKTDSPVMKPDNNPLYKSDEDAKIKVVRTSVSLPVSRRSSRQEVSYKLRKDSSLGDLPLDGSFCVYDPTFKASQNPRKQNDDGISTFIDMLSNRGLAKKRQEENDRKHRMMKVLADLGPTEEATSSAKKVVVGEGYDSVLPKTTNPESLDLSESLDMNNSQNVDGDSGQWETLNLSSSGKCGSHVSIRSSTSSKASLSSEEGYYSNPGSPQNKHNNNRFSIQSTLSSTSAGSMSMYQSEYNDEDLLESPRETLKDQEIPDSPVSSNTITPSSCGSVEILHLQSSPGVKRRYSTSSIAESKTPPSISEKSKTLSRSPKPFKDVSNERNGESDERTVAGTARIIISKVKSAPIDIPNKTKCESIDTCKDFKASPNASFTSNFGVHMCSGPVKDNAEITIASVSRKDPPNWGKLLPDAPHLPSRCQASPVSVSKSDVRSRRSFETPRSFTEEPKSEAGSRRSLNLTVPASQQLSSSPVGVVMMSPVMCKAPKVPSWRKPNPTVSVTEGGGKQGMENLDKCEVKTIQKKQSTSCNTDAPPRPVEQKPADPKVISGVGKSADKTKNAEMSTAERCDSHRRQQVEYCKEKMKTPKITINIAIDSDHERKGKDIPPSQITGDNVQCTQRKVQSGPSERTPKEKGTPTVKVSLQPSPGEEYRGSDTANIFQYPTLPKSKLKGPTAKDIQEILVNWVEARTPTLGPGTTSDAAYTKMEVATSGASPQGRPGQHPLTPTHVMTVKKENTHALRKSKRMFHSQELYPKHVDPSWDIPKLALSAAVNREQDTPNESIKGKYKGNTNRQVSSSGTSLPTDYRSVEVEKSDRVSSPSVLPQTRPRSQTWSRGQTSQSRANAWVREIIVPPSTPTCKVEAKMYQGRTIKPVRSKTLENENRVSTPRLQWFRSCTDIKDTFV